MIALASSCAVSMALLVLSLFSLHMIEATDASFSKHIAQLADISAPALAVSMATADYDTMAMIATAIQKTPEVDKVEIVDRSGMVDLLMQDTSLPIGTPNAMASLSRPIYDGIGNGVQEVGKLNLYFSRPASISTAMWLIIVTGVVASFFLGWASWRFIGTLKARAGSSGDTGGEDGASQSDPEEIREADARPPSDGDDHRLFGHLFESETEMACLISAAGKFVDVSKGWLRKSGYGREDVTGADIGTFLAAPDRDVIGKRLSDLHEQGQPQKGMLRFRHADGSTSDTWFAATAVSAPDGKAFALAVIQDISDLTVEAADTDTAEFADHLTGLVNRIGFEKRLADLIADAKPGCQLACLLVDIDRFKSINDHHGHRASEELLRALVKRWRPSLQKALLSARLGSDEFALVLSGTDARKNAETIAEALCEAARTPFVIGSATMSITVSIGIAHFPENAADSQEFIHFATIASSSCKSEGGNGIRRFEPEMLASRKKRTESEDDIRRGIEESLFEPHFQSVTHLASGKIVGFEALMRLNHPEKGLIPPGEFIAIAEESDRIDLAGRQLFSKALSGLRALGQRHGDEHLHIAINLSPVELTPEKIAFIASELEVYGVDPAQLTVEITEAVFLEDSDRITECLQQLRRIGCRIALDDFGTGYSSLAYLTRFQVDIIKIDQSFIKGLTHPDPAIATRSRRLIEGIAAIATNMDCLMIAEGVEEEEQARHLRTIGVQYAQGFLFSTPLPLSEAMALV